MRVAAASLTAHFSLKKISDTKLVLDTYQRISNLRNVLTVVVTSTMRLNSAKSAENGFHRIRFAVQETKRESNILLARSAKRSIIYYLRRRTDSDGN